MKTRWMLTAACMLSLYGAGAVADEVPRHEARAADTAATGPAAIVPATTLWYAMLPARFRHRATQAPQADRAGLATAGPALGTMDYRDRAALITRLKELDGLRLLTFWETRAFAVFFGVSRDGIAGLNIAQKKDIAPERDEEEAQPLDPPPEPTFLAATAYRE